MRNKLDLLQQLAKQGISDTRVLKAIEAIPREVFVPEAWKDEAYANAPLPIGHDQTISQPYIVARMTALLLRDGLCDTVLEIGTGSGYQAAVLSQLVKKVYSIERILPLLEDAVAHFHQLKLDNIETLYGDGQLGWPEHAPYDGIIVTAVTDTVPPALLSQLTENGRLLLPLQSTNGQELQLFIRKGQTFLQQTFDPVRFVPLRSGKTIE